MSSIVYPVILATATAPDIPETRVFSLQLFAYILAFLPTTPYYKYNDGQISTICMICYDQYSPTLEMLGETANEAFKVYMTCKTQGWYPMVAALRMSSPFRRCRLPRPRRHLRRHGGRRGGGGDARPSRRSASGVGRHRELVRAPRGSRQ
jgi:hypothetical protein